MKALLTTEQRQRIDSMMMRMGPMMGGPTGSGEQADTKTKSGGTPEEDGSDAKDPHGH